ncbi:MAG: transposase [Lentimicrobium sp.]
MDKFRNKYRIPSTRAQWWDYGRDAGYFVTICTKDRKFYFGDILNAEMQWSEIGRMANDLWLEIPRQFIWAEPDRHSPNPGGITGIHNPMLHDNLSRILRWYKGRVSFESRKILADFGWQSRFYDHIIRDDAEYQRIADYIKNNPAKWEDDRFFR